jgi:hypothetical protein
MKLYSVSYNAGTGGTWLTWFINQHKGFQNYDIQFNPTQLDWATYDDLMWYYDEADWQTTVKNNQWNDKSNVVYKLFPIHNYYAIDRDIELISASNTISLIVPYVNEELKQQFVKRNTVAFNTTVERSVLNLDYTRIACTSSDPERNSYSKYDGVCAVTTIDIGKLLMCNTNEYHQLLKTIHCDELSNWKQLCANYRDSVFTVPTR